ncbi:hypothetical protein [Qipengyuania sp. YIM B01966]|uniref:hypothetical protein n=1 Tax=Qipengyuania sp. YIM B01966 TaxID=2778646 RepID=UPI0018F489B8|nr:hypothetical protein [Qipengyuania sp. YIM B01966]
MIAPFVMERAMSSYSFRSSTPDRWASPRPYSDPSLRMRQFGRIQPMEQQNRWDRLVERLIGRA